MSLGELKAVEESSEINIRFNALEKAIVCLKNRLNKLESILTPIIGNGITLGQENSTDKDIVENVSCELSQRIYVSQSDLVQMEKYLAHMIDNIKL